MTGWPGGDGADASEVRMPAEALLRLSYGRLDPGHTPAGVHRGRRRPGPAAPGVSRLLSVQGPVSR